MNRRPERRVGLILLTVGLALAAGITSAGTAIAAGIDAAGVEFSGTTVERSRMAEIEPPDPALPWRGDDTAPSSGATAHANAPASAVPTRTPVAQWLDDAERAYRARQWSRAMDAFKSIVAQAPEQRHAWLRIGNLHHQRRQYASAAAAYRRASAQSAGDDKGGDRPAESDRPESAGTDASAADRAIRNKALVNLALVNLEFARLALGDVRDPTPAVATVRDDLSREIEAVEARARARVTGDGVDGGSRTRERAGAVGGRPSVEYLRGAPSP